MGYGKINGSWKVYGQKNVEIYILFKDMEDKMCWGLISDNFFNKNNNMVSIWYLFKGKN